MAPDKALDLGTASLANMTVHQNVAEPWRVTLVDTGLNTQTGGRVKRVQKYIGDERFMLTYGDGVSDIDLNALLAQHEASGKLVTLTGIQPGGRFGVLDLDGSGETVTGFREKAKEDGGWINGGFMVIEPQIFDYLVDDSCVLERAPLETLAQEGRLGMYKHTGFWQCMDTQRDRTRLEELWQDGTAQWMIW